MRVGANGTIFVCPYYLDAPGCVMSQSSAEPGLRFLGGEGRRAEAEKC